jgi:serine protease
MDGKTYTDDFGGTSCATPHIAGVAAVVLSAVPKLTVAQMTEVLQMSALPVGDGLNNGCGTGRVDAVAAVNYARRFLQ